MSLLELLTVVDHSAMAQTIQASKWIFPITEVFHLLGLATLGGAVILVNLRLMGWGLTHQPVAKLARDVQPFLRGSLALMVLSGGTLFISEATKCYYHEIFWYKMGLLATALLYTFTWQKRVVFGPGVFGPGAQRLTAIVSMTLWSGVGISGRWIGFT